MVRIELHGRRVGGWVVAVHDDGGHAVKPIAKVTGWGPPPELLALSRWAAWRWAGPRATLLRTASPPGAVRSLPPPAPAPSPVTAPVATATTVVAEALAAGGGVVRLPPAVDLAGLVLAVVAARGPALVLAPSVAGAAHVGLRLRRAGLAVAVAPRDWARAMAGGSTVVGARAAAWAPLPGAGAVVVLDEHDEGYAEERAPTWNARDVAVERARRSGIPWLLTSPSPSLEALALAPARAPSRSHEREGWPVLDVVDRRRDDPRTGLYSEALVALLRSGRRVVCVLNRKGRARLLACAACGELARCEVCDAAVEQGAEGDGLRCRRCGTTRPVLCAACGSSRLKLLRVGVSRVREELAALVGEEVADHEAPTTRVVVGTEAVLHRVESADAVAFLDVDQELLAPRYRAAEQAMALLVRAARLVGGRAGGGRLLAQTRVPRHEVLDAVLHADPSRLAQAEDARRRALRLPPHAAIALVSGQAAPALVGQLRGVEAMGPTDGRWLVRAPDHATLCDALAAVPRPPGRLRVEVDPLRA
jgi:primosomal protein N' (replication factor Y) (superfamily II helicase)